MYIDPGAGSLAFQLLASVVVGAAFTFRRGLTKILSVFRRGTPANAEKAGSEAGPGDKPTP